MCGQTVYRPDIPERDIRAARADKAFDYWFTRLMVLPSSLRRDESCGSWVLELKRLDARKSRLEGTGP